MKKLIMTCLSLLLTASVTKATEVPGAVTKAFELKFPSVKKVKWDKEKNNDFEASFILDKREVSATYSPDGKWKETETEIEISELPKSVTEALNKAHPGAKIKEASKIQRADNSVVYETEVKIKMKCSDLLFDENGNEVK